MNKISVIQYNCVIKYIWSYGIQLWDWAKNSQIIQTFQNKVQLDPAQGYVPSKQSCTKQR